VKSSDFGRIIIGSVVPQLTTIVSSALHKIHQLEPVLVNRNTISEVKHQSNQMGTDIYANLVAAHHLYPKDKKKLIIDFGTALTASCVNEDGQVQGVIIAPGIITSLNSLVQQTAQLPEIELVPPKKVLGNDTVSCMVSGMVYGYLGMVRQWQEIFNDRRYSYVDLEVSPNFLKLADAFDLKAARLDSVETFNKEFKSYITSDESIVLDCRVEREDNVLPMIPAGGTISGMMGKKGVL